MIFSILIIIIVCLILTIILIVKDEYNFASIFFILFLVSIVVFIVVGYKSDKDIQEIESNDDIPSIEVYRGNTELQIIYQDSIPIDSVVVYKNK